MRADVVSLLIAIDWDRSSFPSRLFREDGTQMSAEETDLVGSATFEEVEAGANYFRTLKDFADTQAGHAQRLVELTAPYFARPGVETMADVEPLMTDEERAEVAEIVAAIAPDGQMVIGRTDQST